MKRKQFTTTLKEDDLKRMKKLAIDLDRSVNDLLEEGIEHLLKNYEKKPRDNHLTVAFTWVYLPS